MEDENVEELKKIYGEIDEKGKREIDKAVMDGFNNVFTPAPVYLSVNTENKSE